MQEVEKTTELTPEAEAKKLRMEGNKSSLNKLMIIRSLHLRKLPKTLSWKSFRLG
jgi:hypothetical protein